jgi:hypothetical protein
MEDKKSGGILGCDISGDMLRHWRRKAAALGLEPRLYFFLDYDEKS